ncbi:MAG: DUF2892 domain-containing protein [Verrucomicrobia bacterium]|nr:DUF2892 domain-containing protein [Verrucomicrobiota bacterium]
MKHIFERNIDSKGRLIRAIGALALLTGGGFAFLYSTWLGLVLIASGLFVGFEALRGWCALRACGIKTKF